MYKLSCEHDIICVFHILDYASQFDNFEWYMIAATNKTHLQLLINQKCNEYSF